MHLHTTIMVKSSKMKTIGIDILIPFCRYNQSMPTPTHPLYLSLLNKFDKNRNCIKSMAKHEIQHTQKKEKRLYMVWNNLYISGCSHDTTIHRVADSRRAYCLRLGDEQLHLR